MVGVVEHRSSSRRWVVAWPSTGPAASAGWWRGRARVQQPAVRCDKLKGTIGQDDGVLSRLRTGVLSRLRTRVLSRLRTAVLSRLRA